MKRFMDFFKRKDSEKKNHYLTKGSNGLPVWVIEPPESLQLKGNEKPQTQPKENSHE